MAYDLVIYFACLLLACIAVILCYACLVVASDAEIQARKSFEELMRLKAELNQKKEQKQSDNKIGGSIDAEIDN